MTIRDSGKNNVIVGAEYLTDKCKVLLDANNARIEIDEGFRVRTELLIEIKGDGAFVKIGKNADVNRLKIHVFGTGGLKIGHSFKLNGTMFASVIGPGTKVDIGDDCLFASVRFRTSDPHKIYTLTGKNRLNPPDDIFVEDHVWLAEDVLLLKGSRVCKGSVVGARSLVTSEIPPNSLAVGTPAKVLRSDIRWEY